ncbi:MAG TPA: TonB-dependent receptor [Burkholderiaceae bacterium]|nr:TonB-dependent receptor [Burkholderiaceae bacterium]
MPPCLTHFAPPPASIAAALCALALPLAAAHAATAGADTHLEEIVVDGGKSALPSVPADLPAVTEGISRQQMAESVNVINTEDALKYLPSIQIRKRFIGDTNGIVATRTSGTLMSARSLVYADNLLLSNLLGNSYSYPPRWGLVTPEEIERVDVIYGPFSALYPGNAMGAVIQMTTRMPDRFEAHAATQVFRQNFRLYGTDQSLSGKQASAALGGKNGAWSWWLNLNHLQNDGQPMSFLTRPVSAANAGPGDQVVTGAVSDLDQNGKPRLILGATSLTRTRQDHAKLKLAYDFSRDWRATYTLGIWQGKTDSDVASYLKDAAGNPVYSGAVNIGGKRYALAATDLNPGKADQEHWLQGFSLASNTKGEWDWEAVASVYDYRKDLSRSPSTALPGATGGGAGSIADMDGTGWSTLDLRGIWRPNPAHGQHRISFGYHYDRYRLDARVFDTANWLSGSAGNRSSAFAGNTETQALYAQDAWSFAPDWQAIIGGRWESWRAFGGTLAKGNSTLPFAQRRQNFFSPKLAATFQPGPAWSLRASLGKAYRMPTVAELYQGSISNNSIVNNDPNLKPEQALSAEFSAERELGNGLLRTTLFQETVRDALYSQTDVNTNITNIQNIDRIRTRGIEIAWQALDVGVRGLDLGGSVTYADSVILQNDRNPASVGMRQPRVPNWRAAFTATYRQGQHWSYSLSGRYSGKQFGTLANSDGNGNTYGGVGTFFVLDARLRYRMNRQWSAALGIDNLNNAEYFVSHPYPQRTVSAELKYGF